MGRYFPDLPARTRAQMGAVTPATRLVAEEVFHHHPVAYLWGKSDSPTGEHPLGLALDFSVLAYGNGVKDPGPADPALGNAIAGYLWANRQRLGVWYVIWNRRIISTQRDSYAFGRWVTYRRDNPHTDHVHVSRYANAAYKPPTTQEEPDMAITDADARKIAAAVWAQKLDPGPFAERVGGYPANTTYTAGGLQVGGDAYGREDHRMWPEVFEAIAELAAAEYAPDRQALATKMTARARELRAVEAPEPPEAA